MITRMKNIYKNLIINGKKEGGFVIQLPEVYMWAYIEVKVHNIGPETLKGEDLKFSTQGVRTEDLRIFLCVSILIVNSHYSIKSTRHNHTGW
jgi:hypothetical protein